LIPPLSEFTPRPAEERIVAISLLEALQRVPDPRSRFGKSYPLPAVLALVVLAMLLGRRSLTAIAKLVDHYGPELALALGFRHYKTPSAMMLSSLLRRLDVRAFEQILGEWIAQFLPLDGSTDAPEPTPVNRDGKTLRGSRPAGIDLPGVHLVAIFAPHIQGVLAQIRVHARTNEHKAALELLDILPRRSGGHLVTGDAMFCQKNGCDKVIERRDDDLLRVKDHPPSPILDIDSGLSFTEMDRTFSSGGSHSAV
jgi:hypothetical protein